MGAIAPALGAGTVSAGIDWQQQKLTSADNDYSNKYKRDNTGYYLTTQQKLDTVTLEGSVRGDDNDQFGWNGAPADCGRLGVCAGLPFYRVLWHRLPEAPTLGQLYGQERLLFSLTRI